MTEESSKAGNFLGLTLIAIILFAQFGLAVLRSNGISLGTGYGAIAVGVNLLVFAGVLFASHYFTNSTFLFRWIRWFCQRFIVVGADFALLVFGTITGVLGLVGIAMGLR